MRFIFDRRSYAALGGGVVFFVLILLILVSHSSQNNAATATVDFGTVNETVSVSGFVEAKNTAELSFLTTGVVTEVFVDEGDEVKAGDMLATMASEKLVAQRKEALATLQLAQAALNESLYGASAEAREVNTSKLTKAQAELEHVKQEQADLVINARRTMLSTSLEALPKDPDNDNPAPLITGTYICDEEGQYQVNILSQGENNTSRHYRITGLETGTYTAYEEAPTAMGDCGLMIQFATGAVAEYAGDDWVVNVPNARSSSYVANYNAYQLALQTSRNTIEAAENNLDLVTKEVTESNSPARSEILTQKQAAVTQAAAKIDQIDAELSDRSIVAPFDGMVSDVSIIAGETANSDPVITVLAEDDFEVTARVPEIDIRKIETNQPVSIQFDAATHETWTGTVKYVPLQATEIDGVAYFEITILLDEIPSWIRSGLNADIDIIVDQSAQTLRLPKRFILAEDGQYFVWLDGDKTQIDVTFIGNDGYMAVSGLSEGDVVDTPTSSP